LVLGQIDKLRAACKIVPLGKFRSGKPKYWCKAHFVFLDAIGSDVPAKCSKCDDSPIKETDKYKLSPEDWLGGIGVWGALDPVHNTSPHQKHESGIHLHARMEEEGDKQIDTTFKEIEVKTPEVNLFGNRYIILNTEIAHAYTASMVFGKEMKYLTCPHCEKPHIDADYFAVTYHKKHMCTFCGRDFIDDEKGISNPVIEIQRLFKSAQDQRTIKMVENELDILQKDFPGGIQIWGSNPAIIWTAKREEEAGIHVHVFSDKEGKEAFEDETFGKVKIDGIELNGMEIRFLMVQQSLRYLQGKILAINCPKCESPHCDRGDNGVRPHEHHLCEFCSHEFTTPIKCVGNPAIEKLKILRENYDALQK
jgi:transposase-like protein